MCQRCLGKAHRILRESLGWTYSVVSLLDIVLGSVNLLCCCVHRHCRNVSSELEVEMISREFYPERIGLSSEMERIYENDLRKSEKGRRSVPNSHG